jgi:DNA polymerase-4
MSSQRHIAHLDLDAFFVEVECLRDPSLRGKPLIVGGSRDRGVVTTCSYEARKFGVHSSMPMKTAIQKCPDATVLQGARGEYSKYSRWVTAIIAEKAPLFEKASIDEFYIDLTGMDRFHRPLAWTVRLREEIMQQTGLPISFGLAANKMIAKMATNEAKPNGYLQVPAGREAEFLAPLAVGCIPGVGSHTEQLLHEMGIRTIGALASYPVEVLASRLGKAGEDLSRKAQGMHDSEVHPYHEARSISTEQTFEENIGDTETLLAELVRMTEKVAFQLREQNKMAGCLAVKIRYPDFDTTTRQAVIPYTFYDDELIPFAREIFNKLYRKGEKVRLLGVRLSELTAEAMQTNLFSDAQKKAVLYKAIDEVKGRFGKSSLTRGGGMNGHGKK